MRLDPSAVSHAVGQLERDLDVMLFYRTTRQLRLTSEGESLFSRAKDLLQQASELENAVRTQKALSGVLRIGLHVPINRNIVMPRITDFMRRHPALRIECLVLSQIKDMHASGVDVLVSATTPSGTDLVARKLMTLRFGVYAAPSYRLRRRAAQAEELANHACLVHRPPYLASRSTSGNSSAPAPAPWSDQARPGHRRPRRPRGGCARRRRHHAHRHVQPGAA